MQQVLITATAAGQSYGDRRIIEAVDLTIHAGDRTALVGPNGGGKSTLLRLLGGLESPSSGRVDRVRGTLVSYLPQVTTASASDRTVADELASRTGVADALTRMDRETKRLGSGDLSRIQAQTDAVEEWTRLGGPDLDARIGTALEAVGLPSAWIDRPLDSLSGGQLARVNLASLHLSRLDVALMDEPGNHLDADGLELLRELLPGAATAIVLASHDRELLGNFATDVIELGRGRARHYRGGWDTYRREKEAETNRAQTDWQEATAEKKRLIALERRLAEQARVGERRARRSGETDKFIRFGAIQSAQKNTAISGVAKRIEATDIPEKPWREDLSTLLLDAAQEVHSPRVAVARAAVVGTGGWRSRPIDLSLAPGERVLLTGPNGSGKSSLIAALAGRAEPVAGLLTVPSTVRIVELAQQGSVFAIGDGCLADRFQTLSGLDRTESRSALAAMRIGEDQAGREPETLSPGELIRAELALLARRGAACLLLDEPSNHLDVEALEALEAALEGWRGALVVASHDQTFRRAIRLDRSVEMGGN